MASKTTRDCTRAPKCSILLNNVLGISLTPSSLNVTEHHDTANDPNKTPEYTGKALFESFIQENRSTLHTTLNESLSEIRFAGWIQPYTLLIKGPLEELEVLKEAWRRRFLRSPVQFTIREIGTIKSVDTEIIQQAPFLPLTKAVYEAIAALNKNNLPSGQQNVFEYLAHTYQYVHVPRPTVIRDSLGILFKEDKVYLSGNNYYVLVDRQSEVSQDRKRDKTQEKLEKHTRCVVCESTNHKRNSAHAQNALNYKGMEHAHWCEKHKRGEKKPNKKIGSSNESNSLSTGKEPKDVKPDKKEKKNSSNVPGGNRSKKPIEKTPKKTVWGQIACFIKGRTGPNKEMTQDHKTVNINDNDKEATPKPYAIASVDNATPKLEPKIQEEVMKAVDLPKESQTDIPGLLIERSNSLVAQNQRRPNLVRSNTFSTGSKIARPVDHDIIRSRSIIDDQNRFTPKINPQRQVRPVLNDYTQKSSLAEKAIYLNTSDFLGRTTPFKQDSEKASFTTQNFRPQSTDSFRERSSTPSVKNAKKSYLRNQGNRDSSRDRINTCAVGIVRPWSTHVQSALAESRPVSRASSMKETRKFPIPSTSTPTGDANRTVLRDNRLIKRSVSLREKRNSDCSPLALQSYVGNVNRDSYVSDSPLKHLLTKNTGNTLPVSPIPPKYIPAAPSIHDRSRSATPNRNSFPSANHSSKRNSWRASALMKYDENPDYIPPKGSGFLFEDEKPKRHEDIFPFDYMNQNHFGNRVIPCDCSDAGYSENYERRSVSSDAYHNTPSSIHKDEHSSIYSNSHSDHGILLDDISSSGSSEIQSILNQNKKLENQQVSPYAVAKGEVVLDSSLTFIGIM